MASGGTLLAPAIEPTVAVTRRPWMPFVAIGVPTVVFTAHAALYSWWVVDDAVITWAYARSIADGAGPVLQPGVPAAEGWSNPSWLAVFVIVAWLGLPLVATAKVLAVGCAVGTFAALWSSACAVLPARRAAWTAGGAGSVAALVPSWVVWSVSGLEAPLYALTVAWLTAVCVRARSDSPWVPVAAGGLAALAALTRPDGLVYAAAFPVAAIAALGWRGLRPATVSLAVWAVPVAAYGLWRWSRFGLLVPNTAVAKAQGAPAWGPLLELAPYGGVAVGLALLLAVLAWVVRPPRRAKLVALTVPVVLALGAYAVLERDWMGEFRFAAPLWPVAALLGAVSAALLGRLMAVSALAVIAVLVAPTWISSAEAFRGSPTVPACLVAQINGTEMDAYADAGGIPATGTVLVPDVGGAALVGRLRIVDLAGLAEPTVARFMSAGDMAGLRGWVFGQSRPTFVAVHGLWGQQTGVVNDPRLPGDYALVAERGDGQVWVRRDAVSPAQLASMRAERPAQAAAETAVRAAPRAWCSLTPVTTSSR